MFKKVTAQEAIDVIQDNDTVGISGSGGYGSPEALLGALETKYKEQSKPRNLTVTTGISVGNLSYDDVGMNHLVAKGLVKRAICAHFGMGRNFGLAVGHNEFAAYALPLGIYGHLLRALAKGEAGIFSKVGLDTFIDPDVEGGQMNDLAKVEKFPLIFKKDYGYGEELFYQTFPINVALIKASFVDNEGNVSLLDEAVIGEQRELAAAVHNNGGIVICEVEKEVDRIKAQDLVIHKSLVDYVVINPPNEALGDFNFPYPHPELTGQELKQGKLIEKLPFNERKICARRAFLELKKGDVVNLGIGMPEAVAKVAAEENFFKEITLSVEMGPLGGIPLSGYSFGASLNPECLNSTTDTFDLYDGGYLDLAVLGLAQVDKEGNVNVSKFGERITGPGGFINISQNTKRLIFLGTFATKSKEKKFVKKVEQITFSGKRALKNKQEVLYITEKGVFTLTDKGLKLMEIAPNVNLEKDIYPYMDFKPLVAPVLKEMDAWIFKNN